MEEKNIHDDLAAIRSVMERSQKFISLSGLSGILAGIYALIGSGIAFVLLNGQPVEHTQTDIVEAVGGDYSGLFTFFNLIITALAVLVASLLTGYILTKRKAKRKNQVVWGRISRSLLFYMAVPLVSGGIFIFILLLRGHYGIVAPASLIFYGLSLVSASNFTFTLVKYLGLCEIILGLIAACLPGYGLLFWAIGFGVLHIIYGSMMYLRYDR
ncbi:MAG TPA: hypothetical protein VFE53_13230 [Mucilaginibacter sp.]|jgi:general stress protein CsbA|nr:hypothetical protein [Mucilaginibacter sp.]